MQYRFDGSGGSRPRELVRYDGIMQVVVADPAFSVGRIGGDNPGGDQFDKTVTLASTYANLIVSDAVRSSAEASSGVRGISATAERVEDSPIVEVSLTGYDPDRLIAYGRALANSLEVYLRHEQDAAAVPPGQRVSVEVLSAPSVTPVRSRQWEMALIAFMVPVLLAFGVATVRDGGRHAIRPSEGRHGTAA